MGETDTNELSIMTNVKLSRLEKGEEALGALWVGRICRGFSSAIKARKASTDMTVIRHRKCIHKDGRADRESSIEKEQKSDVLIL